ncbi:MAG: xanthine dehydrogenase family protein subunit M [Proteobacteria bacterium]|nr:xanthine dehydrogenase family protein subunit M [Pseudomonadota bacterium]
MSIPDYLAPTTLSHALQLKKQRGADARVIAGGTDLILKMRDKVFSPTMLIDLRRISLDSISLTNDVMCLGAYVTQSQLLASADILKMYPALCAACREFAGPPIRNRGTLGGNIVNASPGADLLPPLLAYDASVVLASSGTERELPLTEFFTGPGQTIMAPEEILTEIRMPVMPSRTASAFIKLGQRRSMAIALVSVAARLTLDEKGVVSVARIVLGAVAPTPIRAHAAETVLTGSRLSDELIEQAARQAQDAAKPISDVRAHEPYRKDMTEVLVRRALVAARDELQEIKSSG